MKRINLLLPLVIALLALSCAEEKEDILPRKSQPEGYIDYLVAYRTGRTYHDYLVTPSELELTLDDDSRIVLDISGLIFEDCSESSPRVVAFDRHNVFLVGGEPIGVTREVDRADAQALPIYVYFYGEGLHLRLSNGNHIVIRYKEKAVDKPGKTFRNIPLVYINTDDHRAITSKTEYKGGTIEIRDPDHKYWTTDVFQARMEIRGRGNSTWDPWGKPKLPYKIKLEEKAALFDMSSDRQWVLLANWVDKSLLRNRVCFELSRIVGMSWTPKAVPVEVYLNGAYVGVYDFVENKRVSRERVNIDIAKGDIYFEIESNLDEPFCWTTSHGHPMMFKDPEYPTDEQTQYAKKFFKDFEDALWAGNFQKVYDNYIDVDSFINYFLVEEFSKDVDGNLRKSTFLTLPKGGKLEMYHLWDFDISLGNCDYYGDGLQPWEGWWTKNQNMWGYGHGWYYRLFWDPVFTQKVKDRWNEVYPAFKALYDRIDGMVEEMGDAPRRNHDKWKRLGTYDWPQYKVTGSYQGEVDWLKENYRKRLDWMNTNINKL